MLKMKFAVSSVAIVAWAIGLGNAAFSKTSPSATGAFYSEAENCNEVPSGTQAETLICYIAAAARSHSECRDCIGVICKRPWCWTKNFLPLPRRSTCPHHHLWQSGSRAPNWRGSDIRNLNARSREELRSVEVGQTFSTPSATNA